MGFYVLLDSLIKEKFPENKKKINSSLLMAAWAPLGQQADQYKAL